MKPEIIILCGNIGTGKSTLAKDYAQIDYVVISRDSLRYMIGAGSYVFNPKLEPAIWKSEQEIIRQFMKLKANILVDEVGMSKKMRKHYLWLAKQYSYRPIAIILPQLSMKEAVDRRMNDPHGQFDRKLWESIWSKFDAQYQKPTKKEGFYKIIES